MNIPFAKNLKSNHPHKENFVVQGHSNTDGWQDSTLGGHSPDRAITLAEEQRKGIALPNTRLRVVAAKSKR